MTLRCVKDGDLLYNNSKDDFPLNTVEGILFNTYTADSIHNPQKPFGKLAWNFIALAVSRICLCFLSTTPFCCGV